MCLDGGCRRVASIALVYLPPRRHHRLKIDRLRQAQTSIPSRNPPLNLAKMSSWFDFFVTASALVDAVLGKEVVSLLEHVRLTPNGVS